MARRRSPEEDLQRAVVNLLTPLSSLHGFFWCHIPNGGRRSKAEAGIFKALGVKAGVADLMLCRPNLPPDWLELKSPKGYPSPNQRAFEGVVTALGHRYAVCRSIDGVLTVLEDWGYIT